MKHKLLSALGLIALVMVAFATSPAEAQTIANGPYYATPSWDQTLPSATRFIVLSNMGSNAVLDRETGLVWERSPDTYLYHWALAHHHCNALTLGNRRGFRLPTLQELASLVYITDPQSIPALPSGHPFQNVQSNLESSRYWSATTLSYNTSHKWFVRFHDGAISSTDKDDLLFAWCVRGGQGVDPQ